MAEFPAFTPSPARVHDRARALVGQHPAWLRLPYRGGLWSIEHYRVCSICSCIHPVDLMAQLLDGVSRLEVTDKPGKFLLLTPNPIAGDLVVMGSVPGPVFAKRHAPIDLIGRLNMATDPDLPFGPTIGERLACHFERQMLEPAPALIRQPFFTEHATDAQWAQIEAAASTGEQHGTSLPST